MGEPDTKTLKNWVMGHVRMILIICAVIVIVIIAMLIQKRKSISDLVKDNYTELESYVAELIENKQYGFQTAYKGWDVCYWESNGMIEFNVSSAGLGSEMTYKGFYYSPEDEPLGFQGSDIDYIEDGQGWRWKEVDGDNWEYTEKIIGKWYLFEMHF